MEGVGRVHQRRAPAFSTGWGALVMENNLERWDVCVFELLDHDYNIKLHVYRAMLEITPAHRLKPSHRRVIVCLKVADMLYCRCQNITFGIMCFRLFAVT